MTSRYHENLSDLDLRILAAGSGLADPHSAAATFRSSTDLLGRALNQPGILEAVFPSHASDGTAADSSPRGTVEVQGIRIEASPYLYFAVLINQTANELIAESLRADVIGNRMFRKFPTSVTSADATEIAIDHDLRQFLVEVLDSFTAHRATRSWNAFLPAAAVRPVDERNIRDLLQLLAVIDPACRAGVYRRLGDLALFKSGLGADTTKHTTTRANDLLGEAGISELVEFLPTALRRDAGHADLADFLANLTEHQLHVELGPIWYRMAADQIAQPMLANTLVAVADRFDSARAFLRHLSTASGMRDMPSPFVIENRADVDRRRSENL